jgi:hypothetical protein
VSTPEQTPAGAIGSSELRRDVSVWGSYMWGYADVGADIYVALGIVALAALGFTPLAFLAAGLVYVFVSLITLRFKDPYTPRPYRMPLNIPIKFHGRRVDFPMLGVLGMIGVAITLFEVVLTHPLGRIAGPLWVLIAASLYFAYRKHQGLPAFGNVHRNWEAAQQRVLREAEEFESLEEYEATLTERDAATNPPA